MSHDPKQGESPSAMRRRGAATRWGQVATDELPPVVKADPAKPAKAKQARAKPAKPSPAPKPESDEKMKKTARAWSAEQEKRISEITNDAIEAYNAILAKPNGELQRVTKVGIERRREEAANCIRAASRICQQLYGAPQVTPTFWQQYFKEVKRDDFRSGRKRGGPGHENWKPTFKFLTREDIMVDVFEKAVTEDNPDV